MARERNERPTEMPERLFRQTADYAEVHEIARQAEAERAVARADVAMAHVASAAGPAGAPLLAVGPLMTGRRRTFAVLVALAIAVWVVTIGAGLKLWGML